MLLVNKSLSIYIPTCNRERMLDRCLESLLEQCFEFNVAIYISDNNSEDGTKELVKSYEKKFPLLHYMKHSETQSLDFNQNYYLNIVKTNYCWMIADDDAIEPGSIARLLNLIESHNPDLIFLNSKNYRDTMPFSNGIPRSLDLETRFYRDLHNFFSKYCLKMHFSTLVVKVANLKKISSKNYEGTFHAYIGVIFESLVKADKQCLLIRDGNYSVKICDGEKTYDAEFLKVSWLRLPRVFNLLEASLGKTATNVKCCLIRRETSLTKLIIYKKRMSSSFKSLMESAQDLPFKIKLKILFVHFAPMLLNRFIMDLIHRLRRQ